MSETAETESNEIPANASPEARALIYRLSAGLNQMIDRNEGLETELALAKSQLKAIFEANGSVGAAVLQEIALDPSHDIKLRARCAEALMQTERPKLSAVMTHTAPAKLFDILERAKAQGKVIEMAPGPDNAA